MSEKQKEVTDNFRTNYDGIFKKKDTKEKSNKIQ